ncbi:pyrimidine dimer DNA glycosylase/endonuclease V [Dehalogenimonas alkenigignens]|uniref:Pyrimidine dimer DNA glycosylase/DNA-(Apurinic or apyrimidinic site) lyase n=1 Tax=Dehalogenimonas alkenigignens TaxID=1217799 RepID=A0A0W0GHT5_9CHLR|nr:pyrimidine dimer DNA glycosylase/endonuclease V [Dehalogenimonas alkenigignens]KTB48124.1 Pyrimidine dimer DNA glycosylase/DNA-(apurinic or apyrimidinic site) lyase [Dehalogenimonas alkenigignens]PVV84374.1 hypothetical protein DD509_03510 [Dehalogenimonas alkenigignens]
MRMWLVDPRLMCRRHLLGEHVELHMLAGCLRRGKSIDGYLQGLVDPALIACRHEQLVREMNNRGFSHRSPLDAPECPQPAASISPERNLAELRRRCPDCASIAAPPAEC